MSTLGGIRLGMSPLEVKLAKGNPTREDTNVGKDKEPRLGWLFGSDSGGDQIVVIFSGASPDTQRVDIVCQRGGYESLLGLGRFNSEQDVVSRLGAPTATSVNSEGLAKLISFKAYNVAFEITRGQVSELCVTASGHVSYIDEHASTPPRK
jgi:hypothetical protein